MEDTVSDSVQYLFPWPPLGSIQPCREAYNNFEWMNPSCLEPGSKLRVNMSFVDMRGGQVVPEKEFLV